MYSPFQDRKAVEIDFDRVKTFEDVKAILEALQIAWDADKVPEQIEHLVVEIKPEPLMSASFE